ncbi:hypothetical protein EMIHUDRAFT_457748 [Emiliania huxleyi CCMP1516]|uniref:CXXC-type domain-containing protein n=2 Tax=Emiliania huxleyi TaxID=2903 RepID=A0A0D3JLT2_EMIH1|nr:hypothetical protein EMIHUDRAFT_457748 [Emiliania huxleyi CCMP1516]EOD24467.1 hypothetical protein EMIHUDRAFT_457748 [Emiliania huxleyi CCMP1516]|eukprot:XP_005776896.1 hypothetical protein EMIHUDRAFT_457748 [Emiliania huxleyi CCMP1516]
MQPNHKPRRVRCMACDGCRLLSDCGECRECQDKLPFGGTGKRKKLCRARICRRLYRDREEEREDTAGAYKRPFALISGHPPLFASSHAIPGALMQPGLFPAAALTPGSGGLMPGPLPLASLLPARVKVELRGQLEQQLLQVQPLAGRALPAPVRPRSTTPLRPQPTAPSAETTPLRPQPTAPSADEGGTEPAAACAAAASASGARVDSEGDIAGGDEALAALVLTGLAESEVLHSAPPSPPEGGPEEGGGKGAAWLLLPSHLPSLPLSLSWSPVAISLTLAIALVAGNVPGFGSLGQAGAGQLLAPKSLGVGITLLYASVLCRHGRVQAARLWVAGGVAHELVVVILLGAMRPQHVLLARLTSIRHSTPVAACAFLAGLLTGVQPMAPSDVWRTTVLLALLRLAGLAIWATRLGDWPLAAGCWDAEAHLDAEVGGVPPAGAPTAVQVCASFAAELYTDPAFLFLVAGFALLVVANLARASPRFVARATTMLVVCGPTLRLVQALVCSPAELARDVDSLAEGRLGFLTVCVAGGATFGVQPLPTTRKLLAAGYLACAVACSTVVFRIRTGDDRMPSLELLHGFLPFLASFLAALAVSGPTLRQDDSSAPLPLSPPTPPLSAPAACSAGALARAPEAAIVVRAGWACEAQAPAQPATQQAQLPSRERDRARDEAPRRRGQARGGDEAPPS